MDERVFRLLYGLGGEAVRGVAVAFTTLGGGWILVAVLPILFVRRHRPTALVLLAVLAVNAALVQILKRVVQRARPCNSLDGVTCLWGPGPRDYSFPSGHAAGSFAFVTFLVGVYVLAEEANSGRFRRVLAVLVAMTGATCVALSRVVLGVHFPGDVAAGAALGTLVGALGARLHVTSLRRARRELEPGGDASKA